MSSSVFKNRAGSFMGEDESKSKLLRSESRRPKEGSSVNIAKNGSNMNIAKEDSVKGSKFGLQRESSVSKKVIIFIAYNKNRRGSAVERLDSNGKPSKSLERHESRRNSRARRGSHYDGSRRGSMQPLQPGVDNNRKLSAIGYIPELGKIADNQIINISAIRDDMLAFRMIKFSADLMIRLRNPMDDLETVVVPASSKPFMEIMHEIYTITTNYRYLRQNEALTWAKDEEFIEDVLLAFSKKSVEFDSVDLTSKLLDSLAAGAAWEAIHKAISDIYGWFPVDNELKSKSLVKELRSQIVNHLLVVVGNWTWYLRQSHCSLCTQISMWFNTHSADEWRESKIPVVYGAFNDGYDITELFSQILHGTPTLDLVKMNLICTKIGNSLAKYPNQKEFLHLDLFRQFVEFRAKLSIMAKLLQLCKVFEAEKERVLDALDMYEEKSKKTDGKNENKGPEKICAFSRINRTKTDLLGSIHELKKAPTASIYASLYPRLLNSELLPSFTGFTNSLAGSITGPKKYDLPEILPKSIAVRRKTEATVRHLTPKPVVVEKSDSNNGGFFAGGIAIQIEEAPEDDDESNIAPLPLIFEDKSSRKLGKEDSFLKSRKLDDEELIGPVVMPESVCKTHYELSCEDKDTIDALFGISFGSVNFGDIKRILKVVGCTILSEDGIGLLATHSRCSIPLSIMAPFPDLHYKLFALDRIKNTLQDFLGIYCENFDFK